MQSTPRRPARADWAALVLLVLLPTLVAVIPSLAGRPLMGGDNALQNYPLRVLVGDSIRHGHLPLFDPYLWGGTPLLAGWNAGAAFPATWLFAVMPATAAWTLNLLAVGVLAAVGMYWFLRRLPVRPIAAFLGALSFTFAGFLSAQSVHIGLVFGTALLPWICVGIDGLARRDRGSPWAGWVLLTGVALGLTVLAGDPRAVSNAAVVATLLALAWCWRRPGRLWPFVGLLAAAVALGVALSAAQLLPGLQFLHQSERGAASYSLYGVGSLSLSWGVFALVPYLLGGNGNFGLPTYVGPLNWPEIGMSVGLLPLVAAFALPVLRGRWPSARRPSADGRDAWSDEPAGRRALVWYLAGASGVLLAMGAKTPLGHLFWHLPLFGSERLQGRNIAITDFALLVLFALWLEQILARRAVPVASAEGDDAPRPASRRPAGGRDWAAGIVGAIPPLAAIAAIGIFAAHPVGVEHRLDAVAIVPDLARELRPYLVAAGLLSLGVGAFSVAYHFFGPRVRLVAVSALSLAEVAMFAVNAGYAAPPPTMLAAVNPQTSAVARLAGTSGRYAFFDPYFYVAPGDSPIAHELGFFDLGIVHRLPSVQGYGSVVAGSYQDLTATHQVGNLNLGGVDGQLFDILNLKVLLTDDLYLAHPLEANASIPIATSLGHRFFHIGTEHHVRGESRAVSGPWLVGGGASAQWFFPAPATGARVTVVLDPTVADEPGRLVIGFAGPTGATRWRAAQVRGDVATTSAPAGLRVVSVRLLDARHPGERRVVGLPVAHVAAVVVDAPGIGRQLLDGIMQGAVATPHWHYAGQVGPLPAFVNSRARGFAWAVAQSTTDPGAPLLAGATVRTPAPAPGDPYVTRLTTSRPAWLVSSLAWAGGFEARLTPRSGGPSRVVAARRLGPVVAVAVPAGSWTVTWLYGPKRALAGFGISALAALAATCLAIGAVVGARRRRRSERERTPAS